MDILSILIALLVLFCIFKLSHRPANIPPGPRGLPLIGYPPLFPYNVPVYIALQNLAKKYGPVSAFYVGPVKLFVSVVGKEAVTEALHNDDLNGRPTGAVIQSRTYGERLGLIFTEGELWQEQRRFTLRHLRDLGFGKTSIEDQMIDEINELLSDMDSVSKSDPDNIVDFKLIFTVSVINILWAIIGGKRFKRDDETFKSLLTGVEKFLRSGNTVRASLPIPAFVLRNFPSLMKLIGINNGMFAPVQAFIEEAIEDHIATRVKEDVPRDFLDIYLDEMEEQDRKNLPTTFSRKQLVAIIQDLFTAGSETSSSFIGFAILYLIHHPEVQHKMQAELDDVCGESLPSLAHRPVLPYTEAVLMEVFRICSVAPLTVPHFSVKDTKLQGYNIPKGSVVTINLDSLSKDATVWKDPENFRPERHLDADNKIIKNDAFIPFGLGKRYCLGEPLARNTIFLFTASLVKTFEFKPIPDQPLPDLKPIFGFTQGPRPFKAVVVARQLLNQD